MTPTETYLVGTLGRVSIRHLPIRLASSWGGGVLAQLETVDRDSGHPTTVSHSIPCEPTAPPDIVLDAAFNACLGVLTHELRERFYVDGVRVRDPHGEPVEVPGSAHLRDLIPRVTIQDFVFPVAFDRFSGSRWIVNARIPDRDSGAPRAIGIPFRPPMIPTIFGTDAVVDWLIQRVEFLIAHELAENWYVDGVRVRDPHAGDPQLSSG